MNDAKNIKLSIITICFNEQERIGKTLKSVAQQNYPDIEYIVIDGGSTDNTLKIIDKYRDNIDLLISEPDRGIFHAQNKGIEKASGDYILILNGGDLLSRKNIVSDILSYNFSEDIIYGDIIFELKNGKRYRKPSPPEINYLNMFVEAIPHPSTIYKKDIFNKTGLYDTKYKLSADYDLFLNAVFHHKLSTRYIPLPFAVFNLFGVSSSKENRDLFDSERNEIRQKYIPDKYLKKYRFFKPLILLFRKKLYYGYYFIKSSIYRKYLYGYE